MKTTFIFFLSLLFISCNQAKENVSIDIASADYFFQLAEKIENKQVVSDEDWDSLFATPGYVLTNRIIEKEEIKEVMLIAFDPERMNQRDSLLSIPFEELDADSPLYTSLLMLGNFKNMQDNWKELKVFRKSYDFNSLVVNSRKHLRDFLVNPIDSLIVSPSISIVCMDPEARSLGGIIMDFNILYKNPEAMVGLLAHEMFHSYRANFIDDEFSYSNSVVAAMELLLNEGLTDQVDKDDPFQLLESVGIPDFIKAKYKYAYENTPKILEELDSLAVSYIDGNIEQREFWGKAYEHIAFEGHPNGYYMTSMIKRQGLLKELLDNFTNPVAFARIYNKAATAEKSYTFSDKLMNYLEDFEANYQKTSSLSK